MSVRKSIAVNYVFSVGGTLAFLALSVIVNRILTPAEIGVYSIGLATFGIALALQQLGVSSYIVRETEMPPEKLGTALTAIAVQGAALGAILFAVAEPVASFQREPELVAIIRLFALGSLFWIPQAFYQGVFLRAHAFARQGSVSLGNIVVTGAVAVGCALAGMGAISLAFGALAGNVAGALIALGLGWPLAHPAPRLHYWRALLRFGSVSVLQGLLYTANTRVLEFVIGRVLGAAPVGYYSRALAIADMVNTNLVQPLSGVFFPSLARARTESDDAFAWSLLRFNRVAQALYMPAFLIIAVAGGPILNLLFGGQWRSAQPLLAVLALAVALTSVTAGVRETAIILDRRKPLIFIDLARIVLLLGAILLVYRHGLLAVALAKLADALIGMVAEISLLRWLTGIARRRIATQAARSAAIALIAAAPGLGYMMHAGWPYAIPFGHLVLMGASWALLWLLAIRLSRHDLWDEVARGWSILRQQFGWLPALP